MNVLKYLFISSIIFIISLSFLFFNLGKFLDVSQKPIKSSVILSLGGSYTTNRIEKAVDLIKKGYSNDKILILTGDIRTKNMIRKKIKEKRFVYLEKNGFNNNDFIYEKNLKSTKDEIVYIKKFLIKNKFKSAIIVSDPPHTRRIRLLVNLIKVKNDENLKFNIVASNVKWWNKEYYYKSKKAQVFALKETLKLIHTYIVYGLFNNLGLSDKIETSIKPYITYIKQFLNDVTYYYKKN